MNEDVKKLGDLFKSKRKELNFSLKDVENATSIRISHLESIEEGKDDKFLSPVYMLGFIHQYANFLGLDGKKLIQQYPGVVKSGEKNHEFAYGIGTLEKRGSMGGGVKWFPNLILSIASVLIIILIYYFVKYLNII